MRKTWKWAVLLFALGLISGLVLTARLGLLPVTQAQTSEKIKEFAESEFPSGLTADGFHSPFVKVAKEVMPAVVNIAAERIVREEGAPFRFEYKGPFEEFFKKFFESEPFSMPERKAHVLGSGFIFDRKGDEYFILTNNHVVKGADKIIVRLSDKSEYKGKNVELVGKDPRTDIAVLKIKSDRELPVAKLGDSDKIEVGDWAIAIGNPFGLDRTVTVGVISAKGRSGINLPEGPDYQDFIQTDAAINFGNSGGPLINIRGEVIGINTAITTPSGGFIGIGFAIPINLAKYIAGQLIEKGKVVRGYIGVRIQDVSGDIAEAYGLEKAMGALVVQVEKGTPAEKAGLEDGDLIVEFNGKPVEDVQSLRLMVAETPPGTEVTLKIKKPDGKEKEVKLELAEYPGEQVAAKKEESEEEKVAKGEVSWLGMKVVDVRSDRAKSLGIKEDAGVVVVDVDLEGKAADAGIRTGDVIYKVGGVKVNALDDFKKAKKKYKSRKRPIIFYIKRQGIPRIIAIRPED